MRDRFSCGVISSFRPLLAVCLVASRVQIPSLPPHRSPLSSPFSSMRFPTRWGKPAAHFDQRVTPLWSKEHGESKMYRCEMRRKRRGVRLNPLTGSWPTPGPSHACCCFCDQPLCHSSTHIELKNIRESTEILNQLLFPESIKMFFRAKKAKRVVRVHPMWEFDAFLPVLSCYDWNIWGIWTVKAAFFRIFWPYFLSISWTDQYKMSWNAEKWCPVFTKAKSFVLRRLFSTTILSLTRKHSHSRSWNQTFDIFPLKKNDKPINGFMKSLTINLTVDNWSLKCWRSTFYRLNNSVNNWENSWRMNQ